MKKKVHWTQTPAGKARMRKRMKKYWADKNGLAPIVNPVTEPTRMPYEDELLAINHVLMLFHKLPVSAKNYIQEKLGKV